MSSDYQDLIVTRDGGVVTVAINRPKVLNAMRAETVEELIRAIDDAGWDKSVGVIVLTGTGKAFCTGGDQSVHDGKYNGKGTVGLPIEALQSLIRDVPKPVIARVQGYAIGGGNVLATICDLTIASESAVFGQVGPKVGSVDPGFGTAYLARVVGEKKAREIWYLCRRYTAQQALAMGLVNAVVPDSELDTEVAKWCAEILERSPSAIAIAKRSFNADTESIRAISWMGMQTLSFYYNTEESREGVRAFLEKRKPDFRKHVR
ncbi:MAG TPA: enoyl-CoA hydratase-related protein [Xanthobacteraceae bacterium]|nr:enoyl-CoA hydratase-related protein [Xanthobacteraceae bacterium]